MDDDKGRNNNKNKNESTKQQQQHLLQSTTEDDDKDIIMTVGLEEEESPSAQEFFQQKKNGNRSKDLWLIITPQQRQKMMNNSRIGGEQPEKQRAALVSSTKKRDELISKHFSKNGYYTLKITNMEELRDALVDMMMIPSANSNSPHQQQQQQLLPPTTRSMNLSSFYDDFPQGLDEVKRFELFRSVIEHEDNLLNQRVSWLLLAQSFLMAAFLSSSGTASNSLRYVAAAVGLATVIGTMPAVIAAGRNIEVQQHVYFQYVRSDERCKQLHGHGRNTNGDFEKEHKLRNEQGHIFPNMAFRGKFAVKILHTVVAIAISQFLGWIFLLAAVIADW